MTSHDENLHPRKGDGKWAVKPAADVSETVILTDPSRIVLPDGTTYEPEYAPDADAMKPLVTDLGDGTAVISFVHKEQFDAPEDPISAAEKVLHDYRSAELVFDADLFSATELSEAMEANGDNLLDRVAFISKNDVDGSVTAEGRKAPMDDWDEFKDYCSNFDGAVVLPRDQLDQYPVKAVDIESGLAIRDFSAIANDINETLSGTAYTVVHQRLHLASGDVLATGTDTYDDTLNDAGDAEARAESQHADMDELTDGDLVVDEDELVDLNEQYAD